MDIKRYDCEMSESAGGVSHNLCVLLQNMFLSNRIQSDAPVVTLQMGGGDKKKQG